MQADHQEKQYAQHAELIASDTDQAGEGVFIETAAAASAHTEHTALAAAKGTLPTLATEELAKGIVILFLTAFLPWRLDLIKEIRLAVTEQHQIENDIDHRKTDDDGDQDIIDLGNEFQLKDVATDIVTKDRISDIEISAIGKLQHLEPQSIGDRDRGDQAKDLSLIHI